MVKSLPDSLMLQLTRPIDTSLKYYLDAVCAAL